MYGLPIIIIFANMCTRALSLAVAATTYVYNVYTYYMYAYSVYGYVYISTILYNIQTGIFDISKSFNVQV